jgi:hypothetical protein
MDDLYFILFLAKNQSNRWTIFNVNCKNMKGVRVLEMAGSGEPVYEPAPRRHTGAAHRHRSQPVTPTVGPRPQGVQPINRELRHTLAQNKVVWVHAQCRARNGGNGLHDIDVNSDELCGT